MAIAYLSSFKNDQTRSGSTLTFSYNSGSGDNRILFCGAHGYANTRTITGITFNSVALTKINSQTYRTTETFEFWYLIAPSVGTYNVVVTYSGDPGSGADAVVATYSGAAQTGQPDSQGTSTGTNSVTSTRTSVADNCWHVAVMLNGGNNFSAGTGLTIRSGASNLIIGDNNAAITPAGSNSITGNATGSNFSAGATFAPYVASGPSNLKTYNTNAKANIKTINTNAIANVKTLNTNP